MWFTADRKWLPDVYSKDVDDLVNGYNDDLMQQGHGTLLEARSHGNPFFDSMTITWFDNTAVKRSETPSLVQEYASDEPSHMKSFFQKVHEACSNSSSLVVMDADDPELVEFGEEHVHEQLTSHLADIARGPQEAWPDWFRNKVFYPYCARPILENPANGFIPSAILAEMLRQHLGLPYEWYGARVD